MWMTFCVHVCVFLGVQLDECICVFDGDEEPAMNYTDAPPSPPSHLSSKLHGCNLLIDPFTTFLCQKSHLEPKEKKKKLDITNFFPPLKQNKSGKKRFKMFSNKIEKEV